MGRRFLVALATGCAFASMLAGASPASHALTPDEVLDWTAPRLDRYWSDWSAHKNLPYRSPVFVNWYNRRGLGWADVPVSCDRYGKRDGLMWMGYSRFYRPNAYYCPANERLYLDYQLIRSQLRFDDGRAIVVIAHEWGHHIQHLLRWPERRRLRLRQYAHFELDADCYAGTFFAWLDRNGELDANDLAHAERALGQVGDPDGTPWYEPKAHGGSSLRQEWFLHGFDTASPRRCDRVFD